MYKVKLNPKKFFVPSVPGGQRILLSRRMLKQKITFGQQMSPGVNAERAL